MPSEIEGLIFCNFFAKNWILGCLGGILEVSWAVLAKFLGRLGPQLGSNLDPKMALELPKSGPKGAYRSPMRPLGAKNCPKAAQNLPKPPKEVPRPPLSLDFGAFWQGFNQKIRPFFKVFGGWIWHEIELWRQSACSAGGAAPPQTPPCLKARTVAGTRLAALKIYIYIYIYTYIDINII